MGAVNVKSLSPPPPMTATALSSHCQDLMMKWKLLMGQIEMGTLKGERKTSKKRKRKSRHRLSTLILKMRMKRSKRCLGSGVARGERSTSQASCRVPPKRTASVTPSPLRLRCFLSSKILTTATVSRILKTKKALILTRSYQYQLTWGFSRSKRFSGSRKLLISR